MLRNSLGEICFYYISMGCNINREQNAYLMTRHLLNHFSEGYLYPFIETEPENMTTENQFANALCVIETDFDSKLLKSVLTEIEIAMGRDKSDPLSYCKDRPADLDILSSSKQFDTQLFRCHDENHITAVLKVNQHKQINASYYGLPFFKKPATIHFDLRSRHIVVID